MALVKVRHRRKRNESTTTSFGVLHYDADGIVEVEEEVAKVLCDVTKYGETFSWVKQAKVVEAPVARKKKAPSRKVLAEPEEVEEEAPRRKRRVKKAATSERAAKKRSMKKSLTKR